MNFTDLITYSLATYRGTKLVIDDEIFREQREDLVELLQRLADEYPEHTKLFNKLEYLIGCPWCVSIWVGGALAILRKINPHTADALALTLAVSAVTGLAKSNEHILNVE